MINVTRGRYWPMEVKECQTRLAEHEMGLFAKEDSMKELAF